MRSWTCALLLVVVLVSVECQFRRAQGGGNHETNIRLGLVSSDLGVAPVPGAFPGNQPVPREPQSPSGCFCLPRNQVCPSQPPNTSGAGVFNIRIVNRPTTGGACPIPNQHSCCFPGTGNNIPTPVRPNPPRPNPVVPSPIQIGTGVCGISNPIPYRPAQYAEAQFAEYPWMAVILDLRDRYLGGGVLISSEWVLTAAHKVNPQQHIKVRLGEHDVRNSVDHQQYPHLEVNVDRIIIHPLFNSETVANDVALLHLSRPVATQNYPHIGTACLPEQGQIFFGQQCWVTGWGKDAFEQAGSFQNIMKEVDVPIVDPFVCEARLRTSRLGPNFVLDSKSFLCAGGIEGKDACTGDGGAPLVCRSQRGWTVVGLVAWGIGCARNELPGVYVNIPNYVNFIRQYVRF